MRRVICCFGGKNVAQASRQQAPSRNTNEQRETSAICVSEPSRNSLSFRRWADSSQHTETAVVGSEENPLPLDSVPQAPPGTTQEHGATSGSDANAIPSELAQQALSGTIYELEDYSGSSASVLPDNCIYSFSWSEILNGTQNLNTENLLGQGNFGDVFHCQLPARVGAVKIQKRGREDAHSEFVAETKALSEANHPNIISLLGICDEPRRRAIVYQLMPNRSLDRYIGADLDWETRMKIAEGVGQAISILHVPLGIIHRDINVSNILLDHEFEPKLSDFGLAINIRTDDEGIEISSTVSNSLGAPGYVDPEILQFGKATTKSDVYSYGVLLLQLFTGRDPMQTIGEENLSLPRWFREKAWGRRNFQQRIVDGALNNRYSLPGLTQILDVAFKCTRPDRYQRDSMEKVTELVAMASMSDPPVKYEPELPPIE